MLMSSRKGGKVMRERRKMLRALLSALIAEQKDGQMLYIPNGEPGMRRMILALLQMRASVKDDPLAKMIEDFLSQEEENADQP